MKKLLKFSLCLVLGLSLWGCKPADSLTKPDYVGIKIGENASYSLINNAESVILNDLLAFSKWKSSSERSSEKAVFSLIDDQDKTFDFIQTQKGILIRITDQKVEKYYTVTLDETLADLVTSTVDQMVNMASTRSLISDHQFTAANLGNDFNHGTTEFVLNPAQSDVLKSNGLLDIANWQDGGLAEASPIPDAVLSIYDLTLSFKLEGNLVRIYVKSALYPSDKIQTYTMESFRYEKVMDNLRSIRDTFIQGPYADLIDSVFVKADFNLDEVLTWKIAGWSVTLSADDSDTISSTLKMDNWIRLTDPFDFDLPNPDLILTSSDGITFTFGSFGEYLSYGVKVERSGSVTEYYSTGENLWNWDSETYTTILGLWNPPFKDVIKTFAYSRIMIAYPDATDEMGYSYHEYTVDATQRATLNAKMDYSSWTIEKDPWQYHRGWAAMLVMTDEAGENGISIYKETDRTVIHIRKIIPGLEVSSVLFYTAPLSVYENLWAIAKAEYE